MRRVILERFNQGDLARAYDLCLAAAARHPDDGWFKHRAVLCLVRSGALERAELDFRRFRLAEASHDEDSLALGARLRKSMALEARADQVQTLARVAAGQYDRIFAQTGGHYPGINAATLYLLAGDGARSDALAPAAMRVRWMRRRPIIGWPPRPRPIFCLAMPEPPGWHYSRRSPVTPAIPWPMRQRSGNCAWWCACCRWKRRGCAISSRPGRAISPAISSIAPLDPTALRRRAMPGSP